MLRLHRCVQVYSPDKPVLELDDHAWTLRAEPVAADEVELLDFERLLHVYHVTFDDQRKKVCRGLPMLTVLQKQHSALGSQRKGQRWLDSHFNLNTAWVVTLESDRHLERVPLYMTGEAIRGSVPVEGQRGRPAVGHHGTDTGETAGEARRLRRLEVVLAQQPGAARGAAGAEAERVAYSMVISGRKW